MNKTLKNTLIIASAVAIIGLIITIIGVVAGGMKAVTIGSDGIQLAGNSTDKKVLDQNFTNITSIKADLDLRDVVLQAGSSFKVESKGVGKNFRVEDDNGVVTITENAGTGFHINLGFLEPTENETLIVTYPAETSFDNIHIECDTGNVEISDLKVKQLTLNDDLGNINLKNISADIMDADIDTGNLYTDNTNISTMKFNLDLGDFVARKLTGENISGELDTGKADITGIVTSSADISNGLGDTKLTLKGSENSYSYELETDLGDVKLGGQKAGNLTKMYEGKPLIKLTNDTGDIEVDFN